jgi:recombination protein RecT
MSSTELAQRDERTPAQIVISGIRSDTFKAQIAKVLPPTVTPDRFERIAVTALQQNPRIAECDSDSIIRSLLRCAQDGLLPDAKEAALVEFSVKVKDAQGERWEKHAQYMPMIGGYRKIAAEHGWSLDTQVVYAEDEFSFGYVDGEPRLTYSPVRPGANRGDKVAVFGVARHKDGRREYEVMSRDDVEKVRATSKSKDRGPWVDWEERMWEKTAGRRLFAKLPLADSDLERERIKRLLDESDLAPGDAARALYGPSTNSPAGQRLSATGTAELTEHVGDAPQAGGATQDVDQTSSASASSAPGAQADDEPTVGGEPVATAESDVEIRTAADQAAMFRIPNGKYRDKPLGELMREDGGEGWLSNRLSVVTDPPDYVSALWNFARVYAPQLYQEALAKKEAELQS